MTTFPEPASTADLRALLLDYLDFYRDTVIGRVRGMSADDLRSSRLPSGWTPAGLFIHLTCMERRWIQWGFAGRQIDDPWADRDGAGWRTPDDDLDALVEKLSATAAETRSIVEAHELGDVAQTGGKFATPQEAPRLHWILLHVLQEYARHAGHLDIVRELTDGATGPID